MLCRMYLRTMTVSQNTAIRIFGIVVNNDLVIMWRSGRGRFLLLCRIWPEETAAICYILRYAFTWPRLEPRTTKVQPLSVCQCFSRLKPALRFYISPTVGADSPFFVWGFVRMFYSVYSVFIVPSGTLQLSPLRFFCAFFSVVMQMPGYNSQDGARPALFSVRLLIMLFLLLMELFCC
jgi:hypothetical protein